MAAPLLDYHDLSPGRHIRLLKVLNANLDHVDDDDAGPDLECQLTEFDIDSQDCPPYAALSYTWGPPFTTDDGEEEKLFLGDSDKIRVQVRFDGDDSLSHSHVRIGRNLWDAIRHTVRGGTWTSWLWADALCINQHNMEEKSQQVALMGAIFAQATLTIMWLGVADAASARFVEIHDDFGQVCAESFKSVGRAPQIKMSLGDNQRLVIKCTTLDREIPRDWIYAIANFFGRRRYFRRVWMVQEFCLARSIKVLYGPVELDIFTMFSLMAWQSPWLDHVYGFFGGADKHALLERMNFASSFFRIFSVFRGIDQTGGPLVNEGNSWKRVKAIYSPENEKGILLAYFESLLWSTQALEATNLADHVFSLLGLVERHNKPGEKLLLEPDYTMPPEKIFKLLATLLLTQLPHLTTLASLRDSNRQAYPSLPSWCPIWDQEPEHLAVYGVQNRTVAVPPYAVLDAYPTRTEQNSVISIDGDRLGLYASYCSRIESVKGAGKAGGLKRLDPFPRTLRPFTFLLEAIDALGPTYHGGEGIIRAVVGTAVHGFRENESGRSPEDLVDGYLGHVAFIMACIPYTIDVLTADGEETAVREVKDLRDRCQGILTRLDGQYGLPRQDKIREREQRNNVAVHGLAPTIAAVQEPWTVFESMLTTTLGSLKALMRTEDKYLGIVPASTMPGDELWLPCRGRAPLILRPASERRGEYIVLGEAYVYGGMHGELVERGVVQEPKKIVLV